MAYIPKAGRYKVVVERVKMKEDNTSKDYIQLNKGDVIARTVYWYPYFTFTILRLAPVKQKIVSPTPELLKRKVDQDE